jgi:LPXTG-site transpeptidase (sortase) family protein
LGLNAVTSTDFVVNPGYDGSIDTDLLTGSDSLPVAGSGSIRLVVQVIPASAGPFNNSATVTGLSPLSVPVTDDSQEGIDPDNTPGGPAGNNGDGDPTNNTEPTDVSFGPNLFDPPFGIKRMNPDGEPVLNWTMIWINASNIVAVNARVSDPIPAGTTFEGVVVCTPDPTSTTTVTTACYYEAPSLAFPRGRVVWEGTLGPDLNATDEVSAVNEIVINFNVRVSPGISGVQNEATIDSDLNGDGDPDDTGEERVASAAAAWGASVPTLLPNTGFAPGQMTRLPEQPTERAFVTANDIWLEIPAQGIQMDIVGVPKVDGEWDVSWLGNRAGWLNGTAFPTTDGNSVITGHVYLPNGQPGPFLDLRNLRWGDQIIVHSAGQRYVYEVRSNTRVVAEDLTALRHEERPWVTLVTCQGYNPADNSYAYRTVVRAVLLRVENDTSSTTSH